MVASTTADRTMLLRLLRLATVNDEPSDDDAKPAAQAKPQTEQRAQHRETNGVAAVVKTLHTELASVTSDGPSLGKFYLHARAELRRVKAADPEWAAFDDAFAARCKKLNLEPHKVVASGRS